jgi:hypothetical protein
MMETKIEVPSEIRELVTIGIDNAETALALLFDNVTRSIAPNSLDSIALLRRVIVVKWITLESLRSRVTFAICILPSTSRNHR